MSLDVCGRCAGIWFDESELGRLIRASALNLETLDRKFEPTGEVEKVPEADRECPKCGGGLETYKYLYDSPVILDSCHNCGGIFVEDGELSAIAAVRTENDDPAESKAAAIILAGHLEQMVRQDKSRAVFLSRVAFYNRARGAAQFSPEATS